MIGPFQAYIYIYIYIHLSYIRKIYIYIYIRIYVYTHIHRYIYRSVYIDMNPVVCWGPSYGSPRYKKEWSLFKSQGPPEPVAIYEQRLGGARSYVGKGFGSEGVGRMHDPFCSSMYVYMYIYIYVCICICICYLHLYVYTHR